MKQSKTDTRIFDVAQAASVFEVSDERTGTARFARVSDAVLDLQAYLNRLASGEPTPGGGSAATLVGALGAALVAMVARITLSNAKLAAVHAHAVLVVGDADSLRAQFVAARPVDEAAYSAVVHAQALPRTTDAEVATRREYVQLALATAAAAPLHVAGLSGQLFALCERAAALRNMHLVSDVECALAFAEAALTAAAANVRINHRFLLDPQLVHDQQLQLDAIAEVARRHERTTRELMA